MTAKLGSDKNVNKETLKTTTSTINKTLSILKFHCSSKIRLNKIDPPNVHSEIITNPAPNPERSPSKIPAKITCENWKPVTPNAS